MLDSFTVENYRAFATEQKIQIRPITLIFGWNSGGKSALVRFLPLLAESVKAGGPPLWLGGEVGRGTTWPDLVCKATKRPNLQFSLGWESRLRADWNILGDLEGRWQETRSLTVADDQSQFKVEPGLVGWGDLVPYLEKTPNELIGRIRTELSVLSRQIQWISGLRQKPARVSTYGGGAPAVLDHDGRDTLHHLIAAFLRSTSDPLLLEVQGFFSAFGESLTLDNPINGIWTALLSPIGVPDVRVNLCDTGEGYSQVLPVLLALARAKLEGPKIVCLEQPELHLHTKAQVALANTMISTVRSSAATRLIVETHSEVLLTSIQLAIASGELKPEMVKVYWVEARGGKSEAVAVDFDRRGQPTDSTLAPAFAEATRLGEQLVRTQLGPMP